MCKGEVFFVFCLFARAARTVFYLVTLCLVAYRATTSYRHRFSIIGIIGIFGIIGIKKDCQIFSNSPFYLLSFTYLPESDHSTFRDTYITIAKIINKPILPTNKA